MSAFDALNEPVQTQAAQFVTHAARTDVAFFQPEAAGQDKNVLCDPIPC